MCLLGHYRQNWEEAGCLDFDRTEFLCYKMVQLEISCSLTFPLVTQASYLYHYYLSVARNPVCRQGDETVKGFGQKVCFFFRHTDDMPIVWKRPLFLFE